MMRVGLEGGAGGSSLSSRPPQEYTVPSQEKKEGRFWETEFERHLYKFLLPHKTLAFLNLNKIVSLV